MKLSNNTIDRICRLFGHLEALEKNNILFVSSNELARSLDTTPHTIRKDISALGMMRYTRKGYEVISLKNAIGDKLLLHEKRKACIVGLGRLGTALLDYQNFQQDGFEIVAGFDCSINKIERIHTDVDVFPDSALPHVVTDKNIELGIIAVPAAAAQAVADALINAGIKGILNFSPTKIVVPDNTIYLDLDFTTALRFIAAQFSQQTKQSIRKGE